MPHGDPQTAWDLWCSSRYSMVPCHQQHTSQICHIQQHVSPRAAQWRQHQWSFPPTVPPNMLCSRDDLCLYTDSGVQWLYVAKGGAGGSSLAPFPELSCFWAVMGLTWSMNTEEHCRRVQYGHFLETDSRRHSEALSLPSAKPWSL